MKIIILFGALIAVLGYSYDDAQIRRHFVAVDKNGDGYITLDEVFNRFFADDVNGNYKVSFKEFEDALLPDNYSINIKKAAYNFYDKLDGMIKGVLEPYSILHVFSLLDDDNNQKVSWEEFRIAVREIIQIAAHDAGVTA